jgi:D-3-phosphoglycerate dehydrogenase / 2-oxoglutarate reductase
MQRWRVFMTDVWDLMLPYDYEREQLEAVGCELELGRCQNAVEVVEQAREADVLLDNGLPIGSDAIASLPRCKLIVCSLIGVDSIDVAAATRHGVIVANAPTYCVEEVSDHALALLLACARGLKVLDQGVRAQRWSELSLVRPFPARRLSTCTVGLVGLGRIGRRVAAKCTALGIRVLASDPFVTEVEALKCGAALVELMTLAREADFVSVHVPLSPGTRHLIGAEFLGQMKPTAYLVNTSRGALVDEAALCRALKEGSIAGAGLDVMSEEPPDPRNPLLALDNVVLTPHSGWFSPDAVADVRREVVRAVIELRQGVWPASAVNRETKPKLELRSGPARSP